MRVLKLSELLSGVDIVEGMEFGDMDVRGVAYDSRKVKPAYVFVAIEGFKVDGHDYIDKAIENGASVIVYENDIESLSEGVCYVRVSNSRKMLAKIACNYYDNPSEKLNLIGITGTNGKTTTTYLVKSIFEVARHKVGIIGTIGNIIGDELLDTNTTTPESLELQESFLKMIDHSVDTAVMEVSSHALDLNRVDYSNFNIGVFTNLSVDHLDYHKTIENYLEAKTKLFYKTDKFNIVNVDDEYGARIANEIEGLSVPLLRYGIDSEGLDIYARDIVLKSEGVSYTLNTPIGSIEIELDIPGQFSVYNSLAAAAIAYGASISGADHISLADIRRGLRNTNGVKGRFEVVPVDRDFSVIIDFAHTPDALEKVLKSAKEFARGRVVVVFGAGGDRDSSKRFPMGQIAGKYADFSIVTSDNPRTEDPQKIVDQVAEGVRSEGADYVSIVDRREAIHYAVENAQKDDVILLTGKGHETYIILGEEKHHFDEREVVREALSK